MVKKKKRNTFIPEFKVPRALHMPLPTFVQIEPVFKCNLKCFHCFRSSYKREVQSLDPDKFKLIVEQFPSLEVIKLQGFGETLLYEHLESVLKFGREKGIDLDTISNGILLSEKNVDFLLDYFTSFYVSIDSLKEERFKKIRGGSSLKKVLKGLKLLSDRKEKYGTKLGINFVITHENYDEIPDLKVFLKKYNIDIITLVEVENWFLPSQKQYAGSTGYIRKSRIYSPLIRDYIKELSQFCYNEGIDLYYMNSDKRKALCAWPFYLAVITCDGHVLPCCLRANTEMNSMGNVFETDFKDIWNGESFKELRASILDNTPRITCDLCPD